MTEMIPAELHCTLNLAPLFSLCTYVIGDFLHWPNLHVAKTETQAYAFTDKLSLYPNGLFHLWRPTGHNYSYHSDTV